MTPYDASPRAMGELTASAERIRRRLIALVRRYYAMPYGFVEAAQNLLNAQIPHLANSIRAGQLQSFFRAARQTLKDTVLPPRYHPSAVLPPRIEIVAPGATAEVLPSLTFPTTLRAANWLRERIAYTPTEFHSLDHEAQRVGFTVARIATENTVAKLRNTIADTIGKNVRVKDFQSLVRDTLDVSALSDSQLETIFRTATGRAYAAGQIHVLEHDLVRDEFPYLLYTATHDSRVRPEHLEMEVLGLDGTAVYRADDPIWDEFYPPWAWNCRCDAIPLSVEDAAEYGCREAMRWLQTGVAPEVPEFVRHPSFTVPKGWIPTGRRLSPLYASKT